MLIDRSISQQCEIYLDIAKLQESYSLDHLGEPVDQTPALRERCTTFELDVLAPFWNTEEFSENPAHPVILLQRCGWQI